MKDITDLKSIINIAFAILVFNFLFTPANSQDFPTENESRVIINFDNDWRFNLGDVSGGEKTRHKDVDWQVVQLPHDWSIEGTFDRNNQTGRGGGYLPAGIGWYRKTFNLPDTYKEKKIFIEFDGVMANSSVWVNGHKLGHRPFGYISFRYDLTPYLNFGRRANVIAVKADNTLQPASRWYTGAGIYRHVRMVVTNPVHIAPWGVFVTTPKITEQAAIINIATKIKINSSENNALALQSVVYDPDGIQVAVNKLPIIQQDNPEIDLEKSITVNNPMRWDIDNPHLYRLVSIILDGQKEIDRVETIFGIREFEFKPATGFYLNGKNLKIYGVCLHHDGGAVGAAVPLSVWERRLETLREIGVNAIRGAHNPVAPEFLGLLDKMGFLFMNETFDTWTESKNHSDYDYSLHFLEWWEADTRDLVLRDRNHPSIIMWSVGNEIRENLNSTTGFNRYKKQQDLIHKYDPTRPVTMALFRPNFSWSNVYNSGFAEMMDIVGQNYRPQELVDAYHQNPERKVLGTENGHDLQTWLVLRDNPFMSGQFLWSGIDYLGEADWPQISYDFGLIDRNARYKPRAYQRKSWWVDEPIVHMVRRDNNAGTGDLVSDWTPADQDTYDEAHIEVYSNCDEVELFLNGISIGKKSKPEDDSPRKWITTYSPGTLKAVGATNGETVATQEYITADEPAGIVLKADRKSISNDWHNVAHVEVEIVDNNGILNPNTDNLITFEIEGPGEIVAVDNGSLFSHEPFKATQRRVYQGQAIAFIRATGNSGEIKVTATSPGLEGQTVVFSVTEN